MLDREPFLKAIFAEPVNDLPRLVFADWLDDHGDPDWAEIIRLQCDAARRNAFGPDPARQRAAKLIDVRWNGPYDWVRGLPDSDYMRVPVGQLADTDCFRRFACEHHPHWYGATVLAVSDGRLTDPVSVTNLLASPVTEHVNQLLLDGREEHLGTAHDDALGIGLIDFVYRPVITPRMVGYLCGLRECRRLVNLDLSRNDLDNDAVRAVARSKNLIRLTDLTIQDGNPRVKGRVWSELLERFGPEVVR